MNVPISTGVGATLDVSAFGSILQFTIGGTFGSLEFVVIEGSQDGTTYDPIQGFNSSSPQMRVFQGRYNFLRVRRGNVPSLASAIVVFVGTCTDGGQGTVDQALGSQSAWFIDGSNVSGLANNSNDGKTAITPLLARGEFYRRMSGVSLSVNVVVTLMSDLVAGDIFRSTIYESVLLGFGLNFVGTPTPLFPLNSLTVDVYVAENGATGTVTQMTCNGLPAANSWSTVIGKAVEFINGAQAVRAIVIADLGAKTAWLSPPIDQASVQGVVFTVGQTVNVWDMTRIPTTEIIEGANVNYKYIQTPIWQMNASFCGLTSCYGGCAQYGGDLQRQNCAGIGISGGTTSNVLNFGGFLLMYGGRERIIGAGGDIRINSHMVAVDSGIQAEMGVITTPGQGIVPADVVYFASAGTRLVKCNAIQGGRVIFGGNVYGPNVPATAPNLVEMDGLDSRVYFKKLPAMTGGGGTDISFSLAGTTSKISFLASSQQSDTNGNVVIGPVGYDDNSEGFRQRVKLQAVGILTQNYPVEIVSTTSIMVDGTVYYMAVGLKAGDRVPSIQLVFALSGNTMTLSKVGLYDRNINRVAVSNDQGAAWAPGGATGFPITAPLNAVYTVPTSDLYYVAVVAKATVTLPTIARTGLIGALFTGFLPRFGNQTGQVDLPAVGVISTAIPGPLALWCGIGI
jgi:hypothetical protein